MASKIYPGMHLNSKTAVRSWTVVIALAAMLAIPKSLLAQESLVKVSSAIYSSARGNLPFWFYSDVNGKVDPSGTNILNEISFDRRLTGSSPLTVEAGGNLVFRWLDNSSIYFPELYLKTAVQGLQLDAGRFRQPVGLNNPELSVGSMMVSNNTVPVPKISLSTPDFVDVPLTAGHLQFKAMFSHGWLEKNRYVSNAYLHQKYLYMRANAGPFSMTAGAIHNLIWGGDHPDYGRMPQSFKDYLRVITGKAASNQSNAPLSDILNVIGNSVAAYEFGIGYHHRLYDLSFTRLFYLEDSDDAYFKSPWDGVWGANLEFNKSARLLSALTYEYINVKQGSYYSNGIYRSGWTYEKRTLGIPLILYDGNTITNNILIAHHLGVMGRLFPGLKYRGLLTYSRNYGIRIDWKDNSGDLLPREPFRKDQYSGLLDLNYAVNGVRGLSVNLKLAGDLGDLYKDNLGIMAGVSWYSRSP